MNDIQVYRNNDFCVRTITDANGETWFVAKDVAAALEYPESTLNQIGNLLNAVPVKWTNPKRIMVRSENGVEQAREVLCLSEQGLYFFLGRSDKPKALPYQMWVAGEVVPSIRRTGRYKMNKIPQISAGILEGAKFILETVGIKDNQLVLALDKVYKYYTGNSALAMTGIELPAPEQQQLLTPSEIGKQLGLTGRRINEILAGAGLQHKLCGSWEAIGDGVNYSVMLDVGKRHTDGVPVRQLKWKSGVIDAVKARL
ncbi:MAG: hypothetical protein IJ667_05510 [Synergistaceae bacterium]|nr:hypothetical protein [Synergistaceae bacterium]